MRRVILISVIASVFCCESAAQKVEDISRIAAFLGVASEEELSDEEVERLGEFLRRPLKINLLSRSRMTASGLFTDYQVASLMDYRQRHGEILSFMELSMVDGFGKQYVEVLKPFEISIYASLFKFVRLSISSLLVASRLLTSWKLRLAA